MKDPEKIIEVESANIFAEHFSVKGHRYIFMALMYLWGKKIRPSPLAIMEVLTTDDAKSAIEQVGGMDYLVVLGEVSIPSDNISIFIDKIIQSYTRKSLIDMASEVMSFALSDDAGVLNPSELIGFAEEKIVSINVNSTSTEEVYKMGDETDDVLAQRAENPTQIPGLEVGMEQVDKLTNGAQGGDCIVVCAESKTGKSVLLTNWATKISIVDQLPALYIDTEMRSREQEDRILANLSGIPCDEIVSGMYVMDTEHGLAHDKIERLKEARNMLKMGNYYHIYMPQFTAEKVSALARKFQMQFGIKALFFDYIKIPSSQGSFKSVQEYQALGYFTSALKDIAGMLNIPVFTACQANRDDIGGENPDAGKIGGSYRILQLASKLMFLTNKSDERVAKDGFAAGNQQLWIKYQRNGESDCPPINIFFNKPILRQTEVG